MPAADVRINFKADNRDAQLKMQQLQREVKGLQQGLGQAGPSCRYTFQRCKEGSRWRYLAGSSDIRYFCGSP